MIITTTVCPRSSDQFYIVTYYLKWVNTSWTHSMSKKYFLDIKYDNQFINVTHFVFNNHCN